MIKIVKIKLDDDIQLSYSFKGHVRQIIIRVNLHLTCAASVEMYERISLISGVRGSSPIETVLSFEPEKSALIRATVKARFTKKGLTRI